MRLSPPRLYDGFVSLAPVDHEDLPGNDGLPDEPAGQRAADRRPARRRARDGRRSPARPTWCCTTPARSASTPRTRCTRAWGARRKALRLATGRLAPADRGGRAGLHGPALARRCRPATPGWTWSPGRGNWPRCPAMIAQAAAGQAVCALDEAAGTEDFDAVDLAREVALSPQPSQAFVRITRGCDKRCAYCVVPFVRGPEVSRRPQRIVEEVRRLIDAGPHPDHAPGPDGQQLPLVRRRPHGALQRPAGGGLGPGGTAAAAVRHQSPDRFRRRRAGGPARPAQRLPLRPPAGPERQRRRC